MFISHPRLCNSPWLAHLCISHNGVNDRLFNVASLDTIAKHRVLTFRVCSTLAVYLTEHVFSLFAYNNLSVSAARSLLVEPSCSECLSFSVSTSLELRSADRLALFNLFIRRFHISYLCIQLSYLYTSKYLFHFNWVGFCDIFIKHIHSATLCIFISHHTLRKCYHFCE